MKKRIVVIIALLLITVLALSVISCGSSNKGAADGDSFASAPSYGENDSMEKVEGTDSSYSNGDGSKIIKNANIIAETQDYASATEQLKSLITSVGGHISNSNASENASYNSSGKPEKNASYTIKVPAEQFDSFISGLSNVFNVTKLSTSTEDVSESYFTLQARIDTLQAKREGLVSMLKNVDVNTDFTTWQKINSELTQIDTQLNIYNEQLKALENKVSYATITLSVREVVELTETEEKGYGAEVLDAVKGSLTGVVEFFKGLLIVLIYALPFLIMVAGTVIIVIVIIRSSIRRKRARRNRNNNNNENQ
jgi:hypothetical protein